MSTASPDVSILVNDANIRIIDDVADNVSIQIQCNSCNSYNDVDKQTCEYCNSQLFVDMEEIEFMLDIGMAFMEGMNNVEVEKRTNALTYKEYKNNVTSHRGTQRLRKEKNVEHDCPICLEPLQTGNTWHETRCGHFFHPKCLRRSCCKMELPATCPICRDSIAINESDLKTKHV